MDAAPPPDPLPRPDAARVRVDRVVEPLSGLPLLQVSVSWDAPAPAAGLSLEVRYDGATASRWPVGPVAADDVPPGCVRLGAGLQLPHEPNVSRVDVAVVSPQSEVIVYRGPGFRAGADTPPPARKPGPQEQPATPSLLARTVRSMASGEVLSPRRWAARFDRLAEKAAYFRERVRGKLLARRFPPRTTHDAYVESTALTPAAWEAMTAATARFRHRPTFSVLMPVYNVEPKWLRKAVESVRGQLYPHWELCLADDASTDPATVKALAALPADPRIKLARRPANGHICAATNTAADLATGEFVCLMDNDDELAPHAHWEFARLLQDHPTADVIYSDEDKVDAAGRRYDPQFKPDWSPELLLGYNYVNHLTALRRTLFEQIGRFRPGFEGAQDHDVLLRATEHTDRVHHVPRVLYHWRSLPSSTASAAGVKGYVHTASRRAVAEALQRRGVAGTLYAPPVAERLNLPIQQLDGPDEGPSVAVVVHGPADAAGLTLEAVRERTAYRPFTVHTSASDADALNRVAAGRTEEFVLFLETGAEPTDARWLSRLVAHGSLDGVGAATARLVGPTGAVVSAGPVLGLRDDGGPTDSFAGLPAEAVSYYFLAETSRNVGTAGGACVLTRRSTFDRLGGFDARRFPRSLWAADYGLRVRGLGLRCVAVAGAEVRVPAETRPAARPTELLALRAAWGRPADPYHNANCSTWDAFRPAADGPAAVVQGVKTSTPRVLGVSHTLNAAEGAPRCLVDVVTGLAARGAIAPAVWSPLGGPAGSAVRAAGVPVVADPGPSPKRFVDGLWAAREYARFRRFARGLLRAEKPDLVLANTLLAFPLVEAAAAAGVPSVWVLHESYNEAQLAALFPPFTVRRIAAAFALATRVVPVSHGAAERYARFDARRNVRVIHNGVDAAAFDAYLRRTPREAAARDVGTPAGKRVVLAVGTVCERKGQHTLVEAAALLRRTRSDFVCHLVGARDSVPYTAYVRDLIRRRGLEGVVRLVPETGDVRPHYRSADLFVNCSHLEAYSLSVLEAEAFGLPVVSTPCCGVREQVAWGANALRFPFGDAPALAAHLDRLLADDALRADMGRESRAAFDAHLTHDGMLDQYEAVVLAAAGRAPRTASPGRSSQRAA